MRPLIELIRREIIASGVLSFARFMELALDCPDYGYYQTKKDNPGRRGDFFTSVSTGALFGQLLAFQFAVWQEELRSSPCLIEAGAHDGALAHDVLDWLQSARPGIFSRIRYYIIEPSVRRQAWQRETLDKFTPCVRWFPDFESLKLKTQSPKLDGVIFSNELLDAMPVHRFGWDAAAKKWYEWGVALEGDKFVWAKIQDSEAGSQKSGSNLPSVLCLLPSDLLAVLPDGYTVEISPAAENWWRAAAGVLERGRLMAIDYGLGAADLFSPSRPRGTLRAYFRHHTADDILANPGEQDITAHVNFPALQVAGESAGLLTESFSTQAQFLTRILDQAVKDESFGGWTAVRTRQFQTLTHPEHLGRAFRVLVQKR
ncbi:MAG TPA: SAM-dependent methyltransferase [Candidatus Sulfopaludibacter sp.]|nr:SAM-dependent methyltransferase [Candidatus Sulfopaludibacter sp.]